MQKPLTSSQTDIWVGQSLHPHSSQYNIAPYYLIPLAVDVQRFIVATDRVFSTYEALYARLAPGNDEIPEILFDPALAPKCEYIDLTGEADPSGTLTTLLNRRASTPFEMMDSCLSRPVLFKTGAQAFCYACEHFHLVIDAWGAGIVFQRIAEAYEALGAGREPPITGGSYSEFMATALASDGTPVSDRAHKFWQPLMATPMPPLAPVHHVKAGDDDQATDCTLSILPRALAHRVTQQIAPYRATLFHAVILAFNYLLAKHYGRETPAASLPILNRSKVYKETPGFFVEERTLPIPLDEGATVVENLQTIARLTRELFRHYRVPSSKLSRIYQSHGFSGSPMGLSSISYITRNFGASIDGCAIPMTDRPPGHEILPFIFYVLDIYPGQDLPLELIHRKSHANHAEASLLLQRLTHLLERMADEPQRPLGQLDLVPPAERLLIANMLRRDGEYRAAPQLVADGFLARADRCPGAIAIEAGSKRHTFRECADRTQALAHNLAHDHGIKPEDKVLILLPRGFELVFSELAVLLAGATFVPIDPDGPEFRAKQIAEDSVATCLLTVSALSAKARSIHKRIIAVDEIPPDARSFASRATPEQVAYIIYTSGSTGRPKGVEICQREMADHCASWLQAVPLRESCERVLILSSPAFDASIETIYPALSLGNTLVMAPHPLWMPHELTRELLDRQLTVLTFPSAYLLEFLKLLQETPGLIAGHQVRMGLAGGDTMRAETAALWHTIFDPSTTLFNLYGPTEATVTATCFAIPPGYQPEPGETLPIGRPHRGRAMRILDEQGRDVPIGTEGELYIGGSGLARGYHDRPKETAAHFVTLDDGMRYYRSGDIVRLRVDGQIVFRRRNDHQVKIRGFRIEPGEIEGCLQAHPAVVECAVVTRPSEGAHDTRLHAFVSLADKASTNVSALRDHLRERLPNYMVPIITRLDRLPKTNSHKIDRKTLVSLPVSDEATDSPHPASPPQGPVEEFLALLWSEALGASVNNVRADFFALGGHSLLAARLIGRISKAFRIEFPFAAFFSAPTVLGIARELERLVGDKSHLKKMATVRLQLTQMDPTEIKAALDKKRALNPSTP